MVDLINPMGLILASWLLLFLLFSGLGLFVLRAIHQPLTTGSQWLDAFWLGWSLALLFLQLWHFVLPVNDIVFGLLLVISIISLTVHRNKIVVIVRRFKHYRWFFVIIGLVVIWLSNRAIDMPVGYDTGFRDIQAVMWIDSYPIVPGLNNLFSSLAFNQSVYLYDALLDVCIWSGRAYHIASGLLLCVFLVSAIWGAVQLYRHREGQGIRWSWIFRMLLIPYVLYESVQSGGTSHFLTDTAVDIVGFVSVGYVLDFLQTYRGNNAYLIYRVAILILTGFVLKQSFIVFGLCLGVLVVVVWLRRGGLRFDGMRIVGYVLLYAIALGVPFMARGVVTSGYIAYPQSIGRFDVDWAESPELIRERQEMLATNTRIRYADADETLNSWAWVIPWFESAIKRLFDFVLPIGLSLLLLLCYVVGRVRNRKDKQDYSAGLWILIPMLVMIVVWFLSAPNIKYIKYVLWINAAVMMLLALLSWTPIAWRWRVGSVFAVTASAMTYVLYFAIVQQTLFLPAAATEDGLYVRPMPPIKVVVTDSGAEINTPDSHIKQCWHIPLPCTPVPHTRIFERVPGDIRHGFGITPKNQK